MSKTGKIIIGNLKQNPKTITAAINLAKEYIKLKKLNKGIILGMAAPAIFLNELQKKYGKSLPIYAQNIGSENEGAHTGDYGADQMVSIGIKNTIIGHSERREKGETNLDIQKQVSNALIKKMNIVICVGERERHEDMGHIRFVDDQIETALTYVKRQDMKNIMIAYEPVWAIGKGAMRSANQNEIYEMSIAIRKKLVEIFGKNSGMEIPILYGGSVNAKNCVEIMSVHNISGFLLGRASLDPKELNKIIEIINKE